MAHKLASSAGNFTSHGKAFLADETAMNSFSLALRGAGRRAGTDATYRKALEYLATFAREKRMPTIITMTTEHLREYFISMYDRGLAHTTISINHRALQQFYKWAVEEGERPDNPMERIKPPTIEQKIQPHITIEEMHLVLKRLPAQSKDWRILRNRAIVLTLYDTGLRGAELVGVKREDVDFRKLGITVRKGKGDREREVFVSALTATSIDRYLRHRSDISPALFISRDGSALTTNGLRMFLERLWKEAGMDFRGVHAFRRGFAISSLANGMDPEDLRTLAGWESPQMLRRYTKATERERAQKAHQRFSPVQSLGLPR